MKIVLKSHKIMIVALLLISMLSISTKSFARLVIFSPREDEQKLRVSKVEMTSSVKKMYEGDQAQFEARVLPDTAKNKNIKWKSSNTSVAKVDQNGVVTAKKAGKAKITAVSAQNSLKRASCTITVAKKIKANKIELNKTKINLTVGNSFTLTATVSPKDTTSKTVTITNSDKSVVTIDKDTAKMDSNGKVSIKVTANRKGVSKIAISKDGKKAECTVNVLRSFHTVAKDCLCILSDKKFSYANSGHSYDFTDKTPNDLEKNKTIDCSGYVSWVLYEYGKEKLGKNNDFTKLFYNSRNSTNLKNLFKEKPEYFTYIGTANNYSKLKAGDILVKDGHVEIFSYMGGSSGRTYYCWNAGKTSAMQASAATPGKTCLSPSSYLVYRVNV